MLGASFKKSLHDAVGATALVLDYGDRTDFDALWASDKELPTLLNDPEYGGRQAIVIVWESTAGTVHVPGAQLLRPHLTPLDWALAFSTALIERKASPLPDLRIHIIDLTGTSEHDAWAIRMRHQLLAEMPWVTLHGALLPRLKTVGEITEITPFRDGYRPILVPPAMAEAPKDGAPLPKPLLIAAGGGWVLQAAKGLRTGIEHGHGRNLNDLAKQWAATLAQSNDHHDINNVIGPDALARSERRRDGLFAGFLTRLAWTGHDLTAASDWRPWPAAERIKADLFDRGLNVYAIDDQLEQGWARFLCRLIDGGAFDEDCRLASERFAKLNQGKRAEQKIKIFGCPSPEPLLKFLEESAVFDRRDYESQLSQHEPWPEVVFLDLRLYATSDQIRQFAKRLLKIARKASRGLAWNAVPSEQIERIETWCADSIENSRTADEAMLLLPRLLALALPLTPIILFSSTNQTWIKEQLKPYQNIFTGFEKPRVLSEPAAIGESIAVLTDALDRAVAMMRLRQQLAHVQQVVEKAETLRPPPAQQLTAHHIEIYADETRSLEQGITSGIAVCVFPDVAAAENLQSQLLAEHGASGIVWANVPGSVFSAALSKGKDISKNETNCERQARLLATLLDGPASEVKPDARSLWSAIATRMPPAPPATAGDVSVAIFPDGPLDEALRFNLEFTLFALLSYFAADAGFKGTIQIHLATRKVPYPDLVFAEQLCEAFDLGSPQRERDQAAGLDQWKVTTEGRASGFPLVRGWLQEFQKADVIGVAEKITKIKTATLGPSSISIDEAMKRRLFHDIADWVCTASGRLYDNVSGQWVWPLKDQLTESKVFRNWFISTDGTVKSARPSRIDWFEVDTLNSLVLLQALKIAHRKKSVGTSETDALRLLLRNSYVQTCDPRLQDGEYCAQQRVILWALRAEFFHATGRQLLALIA